ncbi:MAG: hypothetical protein JXX14_18980, partial [Deltaproteobacteria bacterium]|nr:hypothetical protein [Deltaproteobacteria bacterium]
MLHSVHKTKSKPGTAPLWALIVVFLLGCSDDVASGDMGGSGGTDNDGTDQWGGGDDTSTPDDTAD